MASQRAVWGIDVGQCALKAIRVRAAGDKVEALDHAYIEYPKILSQPEADRPALVTKALEQFLDKHDVRQDSVVIGVPGQHTLARFSKLPPVEPKKIPDIVRFEANQQIPFDMDEVIWDYQTFTRKDAPEVEVGIFAMRRELVHDHLAPFAQQNVEPVIVQSGPLALYNALRYDDQLGKEITLLLDIGAQTTDLVAAEPTGLWTRNIPIGGNNFTEALVKTFKISFGKAESLKRSAQTSKYARQIFQAMRPVFNDLVAEIQRSMGFYSSTHRGARITRVIGMGNAFKLPALQKFLQSNLGIEVVRPTTFTKLAIQSAENAPELIEHLLSFGVAYGLALQGLGCSEITSNLLPPEIAKAVVWHRKMPWFWGAAASLALSAVMVWARFGMDSGSLADISKNTHATSLTAAEATSLLRGAGPQSGDPITYAENVLGIGGAFKQEYDEAEAETHANEQKIQSLVDLQKDNTLWPRILQDIQNALPAPQPQLAQAMAEGPEAYARAAQAIPREDRRQVFIDSFSVAYSSNVSQLFDEAFASAKGTSGRAADIGAMGTAQDTSEEPIAGPGYVVRIRGRTPNREHSAFLERTFMASLSKVEKEKEDIPPEKRRGFYFYLKPLKTIVRCDRFIDLKKEGTSGSTSFGGASPWGGASRTGLGRNLPSYGPTAGAGGGSGVSAVQVSGPGDVDPVTGEPYANDYVFEIMFQIVLERTSAAGGGDGGGGGYGGGGTYGGRLPFGR